MVSAHPTRADASRRERTSRVHDCSGRNAEGVQRSTTALTSCAERGPRSRFPRFEPRSNSLLAASPTFWLCEVANGFDPERNGEIGTTCESRIRRSGVGGAIGARRPRDRQASCQGHCADAARVACAVSALIGRVCALSGVDGGCPAAEEVQRLLGARPGLGAGTRSKANETPGFRPERQH
jgi:hypothetical protein